MPQGLLQGNVGHVTQPGGFRVLAQLGHCGAGVTVEDVFPTLAVGIGAQVQRPVKHETHTAERASQDALLLLARIAAVAVSTFVSHINLFF